MAEAPIMPSTDVMEFTNIEDMFSYIDEEISRRKAILGNIIRDIEKLKTLSDAASKLEQIIRELGGQGGVRASTPTVKLNGVDVHINPDPPTELKLLMEAARGLQASITSLEKARKSLAPLSKIRDVDLNIKIILENGVVKNVIIKFPVGGI